MNCVMFLAENEHEKLDELRAAEHHRIPNLIHHCWPPYALASWSAAAPCRFNPTFRLQGRRFFPRRAPSPSSSPLGAAIKNRLISLLLVIPPRFWILATAPNPNGSSVPPTPAF